jgi:hypothetical protein
LYRLCRFNQRSLLLIRTIEHAHKDLLSFAVTVLKYNVHDLIEASAFLGPFTFSLFIFIVVCVCLRMFISIIIDSFRHVRTNINDDEEIFSLMWNKFSHWTGSIKWSICLTLIDCLFRPEKIK